MTSPATRKCQPVQLDHLVLAQDLEHDPRPRGHRIDRQDQRVGVHHRDLADGHDLVVDHDDIPLTSGGPELGVDDPVRPARIETDTEEAVLIFFALHQGVDDLPLLVVQRNGVARHGVEPGCAGQGGGQSDHLPVEVDHRASAHPQVELRVELEQGGVVAGAGAGGSGDPRYDGSSRRETLARMHPTRPRSRPVAAR